jgi:hypothetical protein
VRWYRTEWTTDADCNPRWTARWFVQEGAAMRLVRRLHASDAVVELDVYGLVHDRSVTWPIAEEDPSA